MPCLGEVQWMPDAVTPKSEAFSLLVFQISNNHIFNLLFRDLFEESLLKTYRKYRTQSVSWLQPHGLKAKKVGQNQRNSLSGPWGHQKASAGATSTPAMAQDPVSAQPRPVSPCPSDATAIFIPVGSWSPGQTSSPHNIHCTVSSALPLVPVPFASDGTTWIDHGLGSLLGKSGMAIDRHGQRLSQVYKKQLPFLKIIIALGILQDCPCAYMLSGSWDSIFWSHKVMKN